MVAQWRRSSPSGPGQCGLERLAVKNGDRRSSTRSRHASAGGVRDERVAGMPGDLGGPEEHCGIAHDGRMMATCGRGYARGAGGSVRTGEGLAPLPKDVQRGKREGVAEGSPLPPPHAIGPTHRRATRGDPGGRCAGFVRYEDCAGFEAQSQIFASDLGRDLICGSPSDKLIRVTSMNSARAWRRATISRGFPKRVNRPSILTPDRRRTLTPLLPSARVLQ